jgi:hypothetical protein
LWVKWTWSVEAMGLVRERGDVVEHGACVALVPYKAAECGWSVVAGHDGF